MGTVIPLPTRFKRIVIEPRETLETIARKAAEEHTETHHERFLEALEAVSKEEFLKEKVR